MEPEARATVTFAEFCPNRTCISGGLERAAQAMEGLSGMHIHA